MYILAQIGAAVTLSYISTYVHTRGTQIHKVSSATCVVCYIVRNVSLQLIPENPIFSAVRYVIGPVKNKTSIKRLVVWKILREKLTNSTRGFSGGIMEWSTKSQ